MTTRLRFFQVGSASGGLRWAFALLVAALAMAARGLLGTWFGDALPFVFALPAVLLVGWFAGNGPAALAAITCAAWLLVPALALTLGPAVGWHPALYFFPSALLLGFFASRLRAFVASPGAAAQVGQRKGLAWLWAAMLLGGAVPLAMFAVVAINLYHQALAEANLRVERAVRISEEHALKVFETNIALINRTLDAMGDEPDAVLLEREVALHQQLGRMTANLPQLQGIFIIGANGRMIATNRALPAPHQIDFSDRAFFAHHRAGGPQPFFSEVLTSRTTGEPFFDMSARRARADGGFGGTVSASMAPGYFAEFYREIASGATSLGISLRRADGVLLAGWPQTPLREVGLVAKRQLGPYPIFVTAQMERRAALAPWYDQMVLMLALTFPTASGLMYIGWLALQRTRHALDVADALRVETENRQRVEDSLRQSQKMEAVGQLTGGIAHDFNNLLQVISANLHLIGRDLAGHPGIAQRLAHANDAVKRGAKLASQLLAFGRRQPLEPKVVNIGKFVLGIEDLLRRALGEAVEVEAVVSGGLWNTFVDPNQLENAILNLAINARDAMGGAGKLTIEVSNALLNEAYVGRHEDLKPGQYVMLAVSDTGAGMTQEVAAQAFEPFFTTKPPGAGTGLGLSMVYGFVKQSGGHAKIYSEVGHGTTLKLYLPRNRGSEDAAEAKAAGALVGGGETILVVEDDAAVRDTAVEMLRALGYRVVEAADADSAMKIVDSGLAIDLLFTDVVMPGALRSPDLARRASERLPNLAVLYTSGYTQNAIVHGGRLNPGVELLAKPYTAQALAERVRAVMNKHRRSAAAVAAPPKPAKSQPLPTPMTRRTATVLLVEDDDLIRASTAEMMRELGHTVLEARSAEEAVELLGNPEIDVLMADIGLPGMSGDVFAAQVRGIRPTIGIVFATGSDLVHDDPSDATGPLLLRKPYDIAAIEAVLDKAQARR